MNWTPLHLAARRGHTETVKKLLSKGASMEAEDEVREIFSS